jgi:hypothetical protein
MDWVNKKVTGILQKGLCAFAVDLESPRTKVHLVITTFDEAEATPAYKVLLNGNPAPIKHDDGQVHEHVTFLEVMHESVDFINYEEAAKPFLSEKIQQFAKELGCPVSNVNILIGVADDSDQVPLYAQLHQLIPAHKKEEKVFQFEEGTDKPLLDEHQNHIFTMVPLDVPDKMKFIRHLSLEKDILPNM